MVVANGFATYDTASLLLNCDGKTATYESNIVSLFHCALTGGAKKESKSQSVEQNGEKGKKGEEGRG
jgi:hypothetical protein